MRTRLGLGGRGGASGCRDWSGLGGMGGGSTEGDMGVPAKDGGSALWKAQMSQAICCQASLFPSFVEMEFCSASFVVVCTRFYFLCSRTFIFICPFSLPCW